MKDFNHWDKLHKNEELEEFSNDNVGLLWLKTKSIIRKELIAEFCKKNNITLDAKKQEIKFIELFNLFSSDIEKYSAILDEYIQEKNKEFLSTLKEKTIISELEKVENFKWGGDNKNSLDKSLIKQYIKTKTPSFKILKSKLKTKIKTDVENYVLNSWYNHWSSILIEHIFKSHTEVLPTVGQIKSVDFFINDVPFDLKVTYLPAEYIKTKRKEKGLPVELTFLKKKATEAKIIFDKTAKPADIFYEIVEKMKDRNDAFCLDVLMTLKDEKLEILKEVQDNPKILATWLYENQGEMRFGSENRLFLVLVDTDDFTNSWKLKRNIDLLKPTILSYLDSFKTKNTEDLKIEFEFKGKTKTFTALADIIFVVK